MPMCINLSLTLGLSTDKNRYYFHDNSGILQEDSDSDNVIIIISLLSENVAQTCKMSAPQANLLQCSILTFNRNNKASQVQNKIHVC